MNALSPAAMKALSRAKRLREESNHWTKKSQARSHRAAKRNLTRVARRTARALIEEQEY